MQVRQEFKNTLLDFFCRLSIVIWFTSLFIAIGGLLFQLTNFKFKELNFIVIIDMCLSGVLTFLIGMIAVYLFLSLLDVLVELKEFIFEK